MSRINIQVNKNGLSRTYNVSGKSFSIDVSEHDGIELMVSILRAQSEVSYIIKEKPDIYMSTKWKPLLIMKKERLGLNIELTREKIKIQALGLNSEYGIDSIGRVNDAIYDILNQEYGHYVLDFRVFSTTYLEHMLGVDIPNIKIVKFEQRKITELFFYNRKEPKKAKIFEHELYKNLQKQEFDYERAETNYLFESNEERLRRILAEIGTNKKDFYAVLYGDEDVVRDGTYRLACIYYLYGDLQVPVMRLYVSHPYYSYSMYNASLYDEEVEVIR